MTMNPNAVSNAILGMVTIAVGWSFKEIGENSKAISGINARLEDQQHNLRVVIENRFNAIDNRLTGQDRRLSDILAETQSNTKYIGALRQDIGALKEKVK